jgi:hypothetical protein
MKEQQMIETLQQIAREGVPDSVDLWPAIRARLQPREHPSRWGRLMPASRPGWAVLILTLFLALGAAAYAASPAVVRLFEQEPGLTEIAEADLVQQLNLSQTVAGVTVTLEQAYADANRIVVGFTMQGPDSERRYEASQLTLTDAAGTPFPRTFGLGAAGESDLFGISLPPGEGAYLFSFDATAVTGLPEALDLRLVMGLEERAALPDASAEPAPSTEELLLMNVAPQPAPPAQTGPEVTELEAMPVGDILGPFVFEFRVPFIPGRTAEVKQTAKAAGITITLEKVVVTPSETQATMCFIPPDGDKEWLLIVEGDGGDPFGTTSQGGEGRECHRVVYAGDLDSRSGAATLTVTELVGFDLAPPHDQTRLAGPWAFHFQVP